MSISSTPFVFSGALLKKSAGQVILTGASDPVSFDQEIYDTNGFHNNSTNNTRITVPTGFKYIRLTGQIYMSSTGHTYITALVNLNGGSITTARPYIAQVSTQQSLSITSPVMLVSPGDYLELLIEHNRATNNTVSGGAETWLSVEAWRA